MSTLTVALKITPKIGSIDLRYSLKGENVPKAPHVTQSSKYIVLFYPLEYVNTNCSTKNYSKNWFY